MSTRQEKLRELLASIKFYQHRAHWDKLAFASEFGIDHLCQNPTTITWLYEHAPLFETLSKAGFLTILAQSLSADLDEEAFSSNLRHLRNKLQLRFIFRDVNCVVSTAELTQEISDFADAVLQYSLEYSFQLLVQTFGEPRDAEGNEVAFLVIAMGKLGAFELNLSSDIDLIFAYSAKGETNDEEQTLSNQTFFSRLGQALIKLLDHKMAGSFVFRVDMRLRPYGQSGALVSSFDALEQYLITQGREWERYAMIKSRVAASTGDATTTAQLEALLRAFSYRSYVDYSVIDALAQLKQRIAHQVSVKKLEDNIKLGKGGIRELEFIVQTFQLIRGGREKRLQQANMFKALPLLGELNCLPRAVVEELLQAYIFLRDVEHALQSLRDEQTQLLPQNDDERSRLAILLGFETWDIFASELSQIRQFVYRQFSMMIADRSESTTADDKELKAWRFFWSDIPNKQEEKLIDFLSAKAMAQPSKIIDLLKSLTAEREYIAMQQVSRQRFDELMPLLLIAVSKRDMLLTLQRLYKLLVSIARRSAYVLLLVEHPSALMQLVLLSNGSPWISDRLAENPALLDELLDSRALYSVPSKAELASELRQQTLHLEPHDLEGHMETLRYFFAAHNLRVAACEITKRLPLMKVSDYLTWLAEVILQYTFDLSWAQMIERHGLPSGANEEQPGFLVIGYGKLGGIELGHHSDLDLVFIYDVDDNYGKSSGDVDGQRTIDNMTFYVRLGQKIIHFLTTNTLSGRLYEVDMRLRPSGNSGLLVASFSAFRKYQSDRAWTWEHQALVRARAIVGDKALAARFVQSRNRILALPRDIKKLRQDIVEMRLKMRAHLGGKAGSGYFHLKHDQGGIVDIEFMVQYAALAWSSRESSLANYTDNIRILECLEKTGLLSSQEAGQLTEAYKAFRSKTHQLALQDQPPIVDDQLFKAEKEAVIALWKTWLGSDGF